ncbi:hypothetical protein SVIOM74S_10534 [Streptomyces violarus]
MRMKHVGQWWDALAKNGVERKIWLSQTGHVDPFDFRRATWVETLHRWFDHELKGYDNGIDREPMADIERAPDRWTTSQTWPPNGTRAATLRPDRGAQAGVGTLGLHRGHDRCRPALADHAGLAVGPGRFGAGGAGAGGVGLGTAVEPVDDGLRGLDVGAAADVDATVGAIGSGQVDADEGVAAGHEVVVVVQRHLVDVAVRVVRLLLALVAAPAAGVVRAGVHDDGDLAALPGGFAGADDVHGDPVGLAVAVPVESGVHPDGLADGVVVRVDGSALARGGVRRCRGEQRGHQGGRGRRRDRSPGREARAFRHAADATSVNSRSEEGS